MNDNCILVSAFSINGNKYEQCSGITDADITHIVIKSKITSSSYFQYIEYLAKFS